VFFFCWRYHKSQMNRKKRNVFLQKKNTHLCVMCINFQFCIYLFNFILWFFCIYSICTTQIFAIPKRKLCFRSQRMCVFFVGWKIFPLLFCVDVQIYTCLPYVMRYMNKCVFLYDHQKMECFCVVWRRELQVKLCDWVTKRPYNGIFYND
jgi:hypothetical protein